MRHHGGFSCCPICTMLITAAKTAAEEEERSTTMPFEDYCLSVVHTGISRGLNSRLDSYDFCKERACRFPLAGVNEHSKPCFLSRWSGPRNTLLFQLVVIA